MSDELPQPALPPANVIDVWRIDLDAASELPLDVFLTDEERLRADRFVQRRHASRFRAARAILKLGLARYLGIRPNEVVLESGLNGKPRLALDGRLLHFNVTHTGGLALMAFTGVGEVGIDVETIRDGVEGLEIASAYFTANEAATIAAAASMEQARLFLQLWVRKEAVLKAAGRGIPSGLDSFEVGEPGKVVCLKEVPGKFDQSAWVVRDLEGIEGFVAAIAAPVGTSQIQWWNLCDERAIERLFTSGASG
jgi:4'-phosphopantetheinyl transferase